MSQLSHRLIGLTAQTPLHAGSGSADDVIDLPIQREAHSDWPCIFGSSVKGALRAHAEGINLDGTLAQAAFGPNIAKASDHAGSLLVSDARLALLPVRSLTSHFRWVCCPALLRRLGRDLQRLRLAGALPTVPEVENEQALVARIQPDSTDIYLEEFRFGQQQADLAGWLKVFEQLCGQGYQQALEQQFTLVNDDSFRHLCRSALPIQPHIRIDNQTGTVSSGALWYEENLSPETVLYVCLSAQRSRYDQFKGTPDQLLTELLDRLFDKGPWLQIGGNETVGMGWCRVEVVKMLEMGEAVA